MKLQEDYPVRLPCEFTDSPCAGRRHKSVARGEANLRRAVEQVVRRFPPYGSPRVAYRVRRERANFKALDSERLRRVLTEMD